MVAASLMVQKWTAMPAAWAAATTSSVTVMLP